MAPGFFQPPVLVAAGCGVLAAVNCAISSADLTACALEAGGAVNVSAVAAVAAPRNPRRVAFSDGSFDMQHFLFVACENAFAVPARQKPLCATLRRLPSAIVRLLPLHEASRDH